MKYHNPFMWMNPYYVATGQTSIEMHCHNELEIIYCLEGELNVVIDEHNYHLHRDCAVFINSLEEHQIVNNFEAKCLVVEYGSSLLGNDFHQILKYRFLQSYLDFNSPEALSCSIFQRTKEILRTFVSETSSQSETSNWMIKAGIFEISSILLKRAPLDTDIEKNIKRKKKIDNYIKIQEAFEFINNNYQQKITLKEVANLVNYDPKSFCCIFKNVTNTSFHKYLKIYRINIAIKLLDYSYSINEIALLCGIPVPKTFNRIFKEATGMSPTQYKKAFKKEI